MRRLIFQWVHTLCVLAAAGACGPTGAVGQFVHGLVLYSETDRPVAMATVQLMSVQGRVVATELSGLDGRFALMAPAPGEYFLRIEHLTAETLVDGPVEVGESKNRFVTVHVAARPLAVDGLDVEVEGRAVPLANAGFYERQRLTAGFFLTPLEIERRRPNRASDLLRAVPGVRYVEAPGQAGFGGYPIFAWSERNRFDSRPCFPRVIVDGVTVEYGGTAAVPSQGFDELIRVHNVMAMEVYRSPAEAPAQFGGLSACGVILLWTKAGRLVR